MGLTIVIFGGSGNLARRKLIPALYRLFNAGLLPKDLNIVGVARSPISHEQYRLAMESELSAASPRYEQSTWKAFAKKIWYVQLDASRTDNYGILEAFLNQLEKTRTNRVYYLATSPELCATVVANLGALDMHHEKGRWVRLVLEKPFGVDLGTAHEINQRIARFFREEQIFRIDHYLGKDTTQNILVFRFLNVFQGLWSRENVDNIQITIFEDRDVEPYSEYYDRTGVLRDVVQNRLLQLLALATIEAPVIFDAKMVHLEKTKLLESIPPVELSDLVCAQYEGYRDHSGISQDSVTPTFAAIKFHVSNWRWDGVPIYVRTGKAVSEHKTEIVIQFKATPTKLFEQSAGLEIPNILSICIEPDEGMHLQFVAKTPDLSDSAQPVNLEHHFRDSFGRLPADYEQVFLDIIEGDNTYFIGAKEVELSWEIVDPLIQMFEQKSREQGEKNLHTYQIGSDGPREAFTLIEQDGRTWLESCGRH